MSIPQRHRYEQARKANLARELEQARESEAFLADDGADGPHIFRPECIGIEAERRIRAMSPEDMHDELLWLLDSKPRPASQIAMLENLVRTAIVAYMDAQPWQRSSRVMQAVKPVYEALHAEQCRELEEESE